VGGLTNSGKKHPKPRKDSENANDEDELVNEIDSFLIEDEDI
jgi:hypothetical protein